MSSSSLRENKSALLPVTSKRQHSVQFQENVEAGCKMCANVFLRVVQSCGCSICKTLNASSCFIRAPSSFTCLHRRHISCAPADPHIDQAYSYLGMDTPSRSFENDILRTKVLRQTQMTKKCVFHSK